MAVRLFKKTSRSLSQKATSNIIRATSFNKHNANAFYDNVEKVRERGIPPSRWFNADESGFTTVHTPEEIIARKGRKQIGSITSGERGVLVTVCLAVGANGTLIPPFFVFPRQA